MGTAPKLTDYLNEESASYFERVKAYLDALDIPYELDPNLVRGLDYYNHTAFEIMSTASGFGAITTLAGGGRYNGLVEDLGGPSSPGIGFAMSIERLLLALEAEGVTLEDSSASDAYVIALGDSPKLEAMRIVKNLRDEGISAEMDYADRKLKAQMKSADRKKAKFVLILGEDELSNQTIQIKEMATGEQKLVGLSETVSYMQQKMNKEESR